jgi:hypothetical protein
MNSRRTVIVGLTLVAAAIVGWYGRGRLRHEAQLNGIAPSAAPAPKATDRKTEPADATEPASHLADDLGSPQKDIRSDLRVVEDVLEAFRSNFPHDGNPVGSNAEITAVLTGKNKLQLALIPAHHPAINRDGELCDRWGTPFFFHAESGTRMAVRSAGPDKKMWTADDIVLEP